MWSATFVRTNVVSATFVETPPEWLHEGSTGVASRRVSSKRAAGALRAVDRDVGHLSADESAAGHLDVVQRDAGDLGAVETCCMPVGGEASGETLLSPSLPVPGGEISPCCPWGANDERDEGVLREPEFCWEFEVNGMSPKSPATPR